ncbi:MAG: hypothetical protein AAF385_12620, partial [Pseudomonadota bacterium]
MSEPAPMVTIRFSHVDAAGIVFYPRYFEMLVRAFPEMAVAREHFCLETEFTRPNKLGDRMQLTAQATASGLTMRGIQNDETHFSVCLSALALDEKMPVLVPAFTAPPFTIHAVECGPDGHWHLPRYFEAINRVVEQWFAAMQWPFSHLHSVRHEGVPTVRLDTSCRRLPCEGDELNFQLTPIKVSNRSIQFESSLMQQGECLIQSRQIVVYVEHFDGGIRKTEHAELSKERKDLKRLLKD